MSISELAAQVADWETDGGAPGRHPEVAKTMDRKIHMSELQAIWAECKVRHELWNGMTGHYLRERYGDRLYHVFGEGWYVRAVTS